MDLTQAKVIAAVAILGGLAAGPGLETAAAGAAAQTTIKVTAHGSSAVAGKLKSSRASCRDGRVAKLKRKQPGGGSSLEGSAVSEANGRFEIVGAFVASSKYYVAVGANGSCTRARSDYFEIG